MTGEGIVQLTPTGPALTNASLTHLGRQELPPPRNISATGLIAGLHNLDWVEIEAVVRNLKTARDGLLLKLAYAGRILHAPAPSESNPPTDLTDSRVRITGVATTTFEASGEPADTVILMNDIRDLTVESPSQKNPFAANAVPIEKAGDSGSSQD